MSDSMHTSHASRLTSGSLPGADAAPDRYREQLLKWRALFASEGRDIVSRFLDFGGSLEGSYESSLFQIPFFGTPVLLDLSTGSLLNQDGSPSALSDMSQMMVYSHLVFRKPGAALCGQSVSYEQLRGNSHMSGWSGRIDQGLLPLCRLLDCSPQRVLGAVQALGGNTEPRGDACFTLCAFPQVAITYIYWRGDEEFPSSLRPLYDKNILDFIHQESVVILTHTGAELLAAACRSSNA